MSNQHKVTLAEAFEHIVVSFRKAADEMTPDVTLEAAKEVDKLVGIIFHNPASIDLAEGLLEIAMAQNSRLTESCMALSPRKVAHTTLRSWANFWENLAKILREG